MTQDEAKQTEDVKDQGTSQSTDNQSEETKGIHGEATDKLEEAVVDGAPEKESTDEKPENPSTSEKEEPTSDLINKENTDEANGAESTDKPDENPPTEGPLTDIGKREEKPEESIADKLEESVSDKPEEKGKESDETTEDQSHEVVKKRMIHDILNGSSNHVGIPEQDILDELGVRLGCDSRTGGLRRKVMNADGETFESKCANYYKACQTEQMLDQQ